MPQSAPQTKTGLLARLPDNMWADGLLYNAKGNVLLDWIGLNWTTGGEIDAP
jgi:hypothetical protein